MTLGSVSSNPNASVSTRRGIAWADKAPIEDSSVLVLTAPSRHYVDVRFALQGPPTEGPFWAFAGTAKYSHFACPATSEGEGSVNPGWNRGIIGEWAHPIDSMGNFDNVDRGDIFSIAEASDDQIEFGTLENPDTGKVELYKEYWTYPEGSRTVTPCVVAQMEVDGKLSGMIIQVGVWAQGLRQLEKEKVEVERWHKDGQWVKDGKSTSLGGLPVEWLLEPGRKVGDQTELQGHVWQITETA